MQQVFRLFFDAVDEHPVIPAGEAQGRERHPVGGDGLQGFQISLVGVGHHDGVALAVEQQGHHDAGHPVGPGHVPVGVDIHRGGKLVPDALIAVFRVGHQIDGHAADELRNPEARGLDFRDIAHPGVAGTADVPVMQPEGQAAQLQCIGPGSG